MQQHKNKPFHRKFCLLSSQEYNDDIKWTSSSSGEYENRSQAKLCSSYKNKSRKRKRKKKVLNNLSNLDITIIDPHKDKKSDLEKSPILKSKRLINSVSPILSSNGLSLNNSETSPILPTKIVKSKSPIVHLKTLPHCLAKVRKKLSYDKRNYKEVNNTDQRNIICKKEVDNIGLKSESNSISTLTDRSHSLKTKLEERVKTFFDSNFNSENTSLHISDTPTPTDNSKGEDIDILSCKSQIIVNPQSVKVENASNSDSSCFERNAKKIKYKKGGLSYRLNNLLKKQNAQVNLWQHERFLATNSNFVIPKEEHMVFRIKKIECKYGCYLLSAIDLECRNYIVLINSKYVNINMNLDSVIKIYEPYTILPNQESKNYKIIVGVCKFECVAIKY